MTALSAAAAGSDQPPATIARPGLHRNQDRTRSGDREPVSREALPCANPCPFVSFLNPPCIHYESQLVFLVNAALYSLRKRFLDTNFIAFLDAEGGLTSGPRGPKRRKESLVISRQPPCGFAFCLSSFQAERAALGADDETKPLECMKCTACRRLAAVEGGGCISIGKLDQAVIEAGEPTGKFDVEAAWLCMQPFPLP